MLVIYIVWDKDCQSNDNGFLFTDSKSGFVPPKEHLVNYGDKHYSVVSTVSNWESSENEVIKLTSVVVALGELKKEETLPEFFSFLKQ